MPLVMVVTPQGMGLTPVGVNTVLVVRADLRSLASGCLHYSNGPSEDPSEPRP